MSSYIKTNYIKTNYIKNPDPGLGFDNTMNNGQTQTGSLVYSHDAYGIDSVRNPLWSAYWNVERHDEVVKNFMRLGFKTGDTIGIDIDAEGRPLVYRH